MTVVNWLRHQFQTIQTSSETLDGNQMNAELPVQDTNNFRPKISLKMSPSDPAITYISWK